MTVEVTATASRQFAFLPWLRLKTACRVAGVEFLPLRDESGAVAAVLADSIEPLTVILSGYVGRTGKPIDNCVVATMPDRGWNLVDSDFETVQWATALLFLASWASNEYFADWSGPYVNSSAFRVVWQRFARAPVWIALTSRRRDGRNWDGGYKHGQVKFSIPLHCSLREPSTVDGALLTALDQGFSSDCQTIRRLRYALPFVTLANTDDDLITETAEAILMGSAFEQLLGGGASAYKLGRKFGTLFASYGSVTVEDAKKVRTGIEIDGSTPERAAAQAKWWVHRKWIEELYDVRSRSVHEGTADGRTWGWAPSEHLVMAAWVFPLAVKLLLQRDGHYTFSDTDTIHCLTVDKLLAVTGWAGETEGASWLSKWHEIVSSIARKQTFHLSWERFLERNPHLFSQESS